MALFASPRSLYRRGVLGMNSRNSAFVQRYNKRRYYPNADSKLKAKKIAVAAGIPVPKLLGVVTSVGHFYSVMDGLKQESSMVVKPEHGSGGEGVIVLTRNEAGELERSSGEVIALDRLRMHIADVVSGLYSLGGQPDRAMIETKVEFDPVFEDITYRGVPDIRVIVCLGVPVLAMLRLPTKRSGGRANLHQGAIGVGIQLADGVTRGGVQSSRAISVHPDTDKQIAGLAIPNWDSILDIAARSCELFQLNYLGIDIVLDRNLGPLVLEVNVRPGLAVQLANRIGLRNRLKTIQKEAPALATPEERVRFAKEVLSKII